jgi:GH18 family chitinase
MNINHKKDRNMMNKSFLRNNAVILALAVSAVLFLPQALIGKGAIVGYAFDIQGVPSAAQLDKLTHVMAFSLIPNANGTLDTSKVPTWLTSTFVNNAHAKGVIVSISVGGGGRSDNFASATSNANRGTLVTQIVNFVNNNNLDGVDIDWEGKKTRPQDTIQWNNCIKLLKNGKLLTRFT